MLVAVFVLLMLINVSVFAQVQQSATEMLGATFASIPWGHCLPCLDLALTSSLAGCNGCLTESCLQEFRACTLVNECTTGQSYESWYGACFAVVAPMLEVLAHVTSWPDFSNPDETYTSFTTSFTNRKRQSTQADCPPEDKIDDADRICSRLYVPDLCSKPASPGSAQDEMFKALPQDKQIVAAVVGPGCYSCYGSAFDLTSCPFDTDGNGGSLLAVCLKAAGCLTPGTRQTHMETASWINARSKCLHGNGFQVDLVGAAADNWDCVTQKQGDSTSLPLNSNLGNNNNKNNSGGGAILPGVDNTVLFVVVVSVILVLAVCSCVGIVVYFNMRTQKLLAREQGAAGVGMHSRRRGGGSSRRGRPPVSERRPTTGSQRHFSKGSLRGSQTSVHAYVE